MDETISLDRVLFAVEAAKQLRLVILDACRDNPFAKSMRRTIASRAIGRGLAKIEPTSPNTMIAFAAKAGSTASDGDSRNSPFAAALVQHLPKPGLDLRRAFGFVRDDVLKTTGNKQEPYVYGSLGGDDVPLVPAKPVAAGPQSDRQSAVRRDYELALQAGDHEAWEAFLQIYPNGFYANLAKAHLRKLGAEEVRAVAGEKVRIAEQENARLAAEGGKQTAEKEIAGNEPRNETPKVASLSPSSSTALSPTELVTSIQLELRRVGCLTALANGKWSVASQRSLTLFNKYAGTKFDVDLLSVAALDALKAKPNRVCPLICDHGYRVDGERCTKISCRAGYEVGDDNACEKVEVKKQLGNRGAPSNAKSQRIATEATAAKSAPPGQILCNQSGCRPVTKGCRLPKYPYSNNAREICNYAYEHVAARHLNISRA